MNTLTATLVFRTCATFVAVLAVSSTALSRNSPQQNTLDPSIVVRFADLNVDNPQGARKLYARIQTAADKVCGGPASSFWYPGQQEAYRACYKSSIDTAVAKVNRPMLTALHRQHSKPSTPRSPAVAAEQPPTNSLSR
jgi:UrcA family protein